MDAGSRPLAHNLTYAAREPDAEARVVDRARSHAAGIGEVQRITDGKGGRAKEGADLIMDMCGDLEMTAASSPWLISSTDGSAALLSIAALSHARSCRWSVTDQPATSRKLAPAAKKPGSRRPS